MSPLGDCHPGTLASINIMALLLKDQGKLDEAELLCREDLDAMRATLGDRHPGTLASMRRKHCIAKISRRAA